MDTEHTIDTSDNAPEDVPLNVVAEAKAAFSQGAPGAMAALVWDSLVDEGAPSSHHLLRFEHRCIWIEVSVSVLSGWSSLYGVVHPVVPARVELHSVRAGRPIVAEVTRSAFMIARVPRGVVRLRVVGTEAAPALYTDWFQV
jgi:hypothetical protein